KPIDADTGLPSFSRKVIMFNADYAIQLKKISFIIFYQAAKIRLPCLKIRIIVDKLKNKKSLLLMPLPYQVIELPQVRKKHIRLTIKRLDLIHPEIQGNKWFKLKYNIEKAVQQGHKRILTFGGAFSNHIHATA